MKNKLKEKWIDAFSSKEFRIKFIIYVIILIISLNILVRFLNYNENRVGINFPDPLLALFSPDDVTWLTFGVIYLSLIGIIIYLFNNPKIFLIAILAYTIMILLRMTAMWLLPLEPPVKMIPLVDPVVEFFGKGGVLKKDLFFSGHTSTLTLFTLLVVNKKLKYIFAALTIIVGLCVLIQHVHYSIDVFAAPFFAYFSYWVSRRFNSPKNTSDLESFRQ